VLHQLWHELGFDRLHAVFRRARYTAPVEQAIRVMVFNRLCDADSKLGALRWLQTVALPGVDVQEITHQHLLRSMDALMDHQAAVDDGVAQLLRPLIDEQLSVVFYDLTTIRVEGLSQQGGDVRKFGMSKEGIVARQFLLGVVQTAEGLPIYHEVFEGNASEGPTLKPTLERVLQRYPHVRRLVVVADRGLLSLDNLQMLGELKLPGERTLEFVLAVPGRRHGDFVELLAPLQAKTEAAEAEVIDELRWKDHRLVVAHNPEQAQVQTQRRRERIAALQARAQALAGKLDAQDAGQTRAQALRQRRQGALVPRGVRGASGQHHPGGPEVRPLHLRHRHRRAAARPGDGRQAAAGDQRGGHERPADRGALQEPGRH